MEREGERILIPPESLQRRVQGNKPIIIEEGTNLTYEQPLAEFHDLLRKISKHEVINCEDNAYVKAFAYKGAEPITRVSRLPELFWSIKKEGVQSPVHVEVTGERLDGSFRTKIADYLCIKEVPAILHRFLYTDIDDEFVERKLKARQLSSGNPDYYEFAYNDKWRNGVASPVHRENAERWELFKDYGDSIVDVGCNEGYISLMLARQGKKVWGVDTEWNHLAYLNKLIFEYIDKKELDAEFVDGDIREVKFPKSDVALLLNIIYHVPRDEQVRVLNRLDSKTLVFQCNLRKSHVREQYYGSHPDDLEELVERAGYRVVERINWRDKPIIVAQ